MSCPVLSCSALSYHNLSWPLVSYVHTLIQSNELSVRPLCPQNFNHIFSQYNHFSYLTHPPIPLYPSPIIPFRHILAGLPNLLNNPTHRLHAVEDWRKFLFNAVDKAQQRVKVPTSQPPGELKGGHKGDQKETEYVKSEKAEEEPDNMFWIALWLYVYTWSNMYRTTVNY